MSRTEVAFIALVALTSLFGVEFLFRTGWKLFRIIVQGAALLILLLIVLGFLYQFLSFIGTLTVKGF